jgi:hypothetical protein
VIVTCNFIIFTRSAECHKKAVICLVQPDVRQEKTKIFTTGVTYMKFAVLLAVLSSTITMNTVFAAEANNDSNEIAAYCTEQAELAGIEAAPEKSRYIKECIDSFGVPAEGMPVEEMPQPDPSQANQ